MEYINSTIANFPTSSLPTTTTFRSGEAGESVLLQIGDGAGQGWLMRGERRTVGHTHHMAVSLAPATSNPPWSYLYRLVTISTLSKGVYLFFVNWSIIDSSKLCCKTDPLLVYGIRISVSCHSLEKPLTLAFDHKI